VIHENLVMMKRSMLFAVGLLAALGIDHAATAQDFQRVAPSQPTPPPPGPKPALPEPTLPERSGPGSAVPFLAKLVGLVLVDSPAKIRTEGARATGIDTGDTTDGLLADPALAARLTPFLDKPASLDALNEIARQIVLFYRANNHPLVDVTVPQQKVSDGTVQILVTEFRAGTVTAAGNEWFSSKQLLSAIEVDPGDPIDNARLIRDVEWLNLNPFRQSDIVYRHGTAPGTTDILLQTEDRLPLRVYAGYDNSGNVATGHDRWRVGFNWGDAFWADQQLSYQLTTSDNFWHGRETIDGVHQDPNFVSHSLTWTVPLPWRDRIEIFGVYQESVPGLTDFTAQGISGQASIRYIPTLGVLGTATQDLQFGYDFKVSNNNLEFGGVSLNKGGVETDIHQFVATYALTVPDALGSTSASGTLNWSPGNLSAGNSNAAFSASSSFARANYVYGLIELSRVTSLPEDLSLVARVRGQLASTSLLPSEQLGLGGASFLRGYDEYIASGDKGVLLSLELRSPVWKLAGADGLQLLTFFDYGSVHDQHTPIDPATNLPGSRGTELASTGLGLRYSLDRYVDLRLDYGFQLRNQPGTDVHSQFGHVSVTFSY
jgi:hemolysin activation/secretion protein